MLDLYTTFLKTRYVSLEDLRTLSILDSQDMELPDARPLRLCVGRLRHSGVQNSSGEQRNGSIEIPVKTSTMNVVFRARHGRNSQPPQRGSRDSPMAVSQHFTLQSFPVIQSPKVAVLTPAPPKLSRPWNQVIRTPVPPH